MGLVRLNSFWAGTTVVGLLGLAVGLALWSAGYRLVIPTEPVMVQCPPAVPAQPALDERERRKQVQAWLAEGNDAVTAGEWVKATQRAKAVLELDAEEPEAHKMLGLSLWRQGDPCSGKVHFKRFVELEPEGRMVNQVRKILASDQMKACP